MTRRRAAGLLVTAMVIAGAAIITKPYVDGLSLVIRAADLRGTLRRIADVDAVTVRARELEIPLSAGTLRARAYEPAGGAPRTVLLVSGLNPYGIDEPRLMKLSRELAASGVTVVTPGIPDLANFAVTPAVTEAIEQAALWLTQQPSLAPDGQVGMMGISFSGGLTMVAAARPSLRGRLAYVASFGGHADLPRVLRYLCTGVVPPPPDSASALRRLQLRRDAARDATAGDLEEHDYLVSPPRPHDYGVALILLGVANRVVPASQVEPLRAAVRRFLLASALDRVDPPKAREEFTALRAVAKTLPQPAATLLGYVNDRDVVHLGARLLPHVDAYGADPALSPARSPQQPSAPVFLLHGLRDNVIPAAEAVHLSTALRGVTPVRLLLTTLIAHADAVYPARFSEVMNAGSFWGDLLSR
jgi:dienelactone hydrolase